MVEEFVIDAEEWDSVLASLYLTKRGEVYVVALEAGTLAGGSGDGDGHGDGDDNANGGADNGGSGPPPPSPTTVRRGGDGGGGTRVGGGGGGCTRVIAAWATTTIANPDVPARLVLSGLSPERDYELYAYGENGIGGRLGRGCGGGGGGVENSSNTSVFSVEPAPSGMSPALVAATRLPARTAREPDEELDVPWKDLSESEQVAEALAALADPLVARAAREAALDPPTADDLAPGRCEADPVSRNKWRSFCRWWTTAVSGGNGGNGGGGGGGGAGGTERSAFLLRECVFAAQQPEVRGKKSLTGSDGLSLGVQGLIVVDGGGAGVNCAVECAVSGMLVMVCLDLR